MLLRASGANSMAEGSGLRRKPSFLEFCLPAPAHTCACSHKAGFELCAPRVKMLPLSEPGSVASLARPKQRCARLAAGGRSLGESGVSSLWKVINNTNECGDANVLCD